MAVQVLTTQTAQQENKYYPHHLLFRTIQIITAVIIRVSQNKEAVRNEARDGWGSVILHSGLAKAEQVQQARAQRALHLQIPLIEIRMGKMAMTMGTIQKPMMRVQLMEALKFPILSQMRDQQVYLLLFSSILRLDYHSLLFRVRFGISNFGLVFDSCSLFLWFILSYFLTLILFGRKYHFGNL